jgi:hypothetical protein
MLKNLFGAKNWYESLTAWGLILVGATSGAEQGGLVPPGTAQSLVTFAQSIGGVLVVLGVRKAATAPNMG